MEKKASLDNPIVIKIDNNGEVSVINENDNTTMKIPKGVMLATIHYGFVIISDYKGTQREIVYPTINRVDAVGVTSSGIRIYEDGIRESWEFSKKGELIQEMPDNPIRLDFTMTEKAFEHQDELLGEQRVLNPITIIIGNDKSSRRILFDNREEYPVNPGVLIGGTHYGFILVREVKGRQVERVFPTQNRIEAVGVSSQETDTDFDVFEEGKYLPWKFNKTGKLIQAASYFEMSGNDREYINGKIESNKSLKI